MFDGADEVPAGCVEPLKLRGEFRQHLLPELGFVAVGLIQDVADFVQRQACSPEVRDELKSLAGVVVEDAPVSAISGDRHESTLFIETDGPRRQVEEAAELPDRDSPGHRIGAV
jgi:hypothetical protein